MAACRKGFYLLSSHTVCGAVAWGSCHTAGSESLHSAAGPPQKRPASKSAWSHPPARARCIVQPFNGRSSHWPGQPVFTWEIKLRANYSPSLTKRQTFLILRTPFKVRLSIYEKSESRHILYIVKSYTGKSGSLPCQRRQTLLLLLTRFSEPLFQEF